MPQFTIKSSDAEQWIIGSESSYFDVPVELHVPPPDLGNTQTPVTDREAADVNRTIYASGNAFYVNHYYQWSKRFKSLLGLRGTQGKTNGGYNDSRWIPRFGIEYGATQNTLLTLNYGKHVQSPLSFQLVKGIGNPNLNFNEAIHRSIGVEHKINSLWDIKAELYDKPMRKLVIPLEDSNPVQYENVGEGYAYGIDIFLKRKRRDGKMGWVSYSFGKTKRKNEFGETNPFDGEQPHTVTVVWGQRMTDGPFDWMKSWKRWNWSVKVNAHTGNRFTPIIGTETRLPNNDPSQGIKPVYGEINSGRLPHYFRADLRLEHEFLHDRSKSKLYVELLNATNRKNIIDYDYGSDLEKVDNPDIVTGVSIFPYFGFESQF